jgi:hypothetical protein
MTHDTFVLRHHETRKTRLGTHRFQHAVFGHQSVGNREDHRQACTLKAMRTQACSEEAQIEKFVTPVEPKQRP